MSSAFVPVNPDDDGPEEGEIEDDEDDPTPSGSSKATSSSHDAYADPSPSSGRTESYERDIRHFELRRGRVASTRRSSGNAKSSSREAHSGGSSAHGHDTRAKCKYSKPSSMQGKENRHVRHKSPVHQYRKGSNEKTSTDVLPSRRDSSLSSVDSDDRSVERSSHYRSSRNCSRVDRTKRKSSSSPDTYIPTRHRTTHHSAKCPLVKILHSVAKETKKVMEDSENHTETTTLRQRLLNMGVMSASSDRGQPSKEKKLAALEDNCGIHEESKPTSIHSSNTMNISRQVQTGSTQTEDIIQKIPVVVIKQEPDVVTLSDGEDEFADELEKSCGTVNSLENTLDKMEYAGSPATLIKVVTSAEDVENDDDDDDIGRLRQLALQSKKHEPPPEDADVLQLRLAALRTALVKKFKTRKKMSNKTNVKPSNEDPLSPLDDIPMPFSSVSADEVMTPVDMEIAETDDEDTSVHSIHCYSPSDPIPNCYSPSDPSPSQYSPSDPHRDCYSPSDPTGSPTLEPSLQELLPPPPPPDVILYLSDQTCDASRHVIHEDNIFPSYYPDHLNVFDVLSPPPLPPYFQELLKGSDCLPEVEEQNVDIPLDTSFSQQNSASCNKDPQEIQDTPKVNLEHVKPLTPSTDEVSSNCVVKMGLNLHSLSVLEDSSVTSVTCPVSTSPSLSGHVAPEQVKKMDLNELDVLKTSEVEAKVEDETNKNVSLEEEEKLLRQRLLLNMAIKRGKIAGNKKETKTSQEKLLLKPKDASSENVQDLCGKVSASAMKQTSSSAIPAELATVQPKSSVPIPTQTADINRFVINLGEDSDSNDYSDAEALGRKCARNKANWLLHMKKMEATPPEILSSIMKSVPVKTHKSPTCSNLNTKSVTVESYKKKPFVENLAALECSVERFLKDIRSSHESSRSPSGGTSTASHATPVAVKHLPAAQQEEYRRLKQQIAELEKQRLASSTFKRQGPTTILRGTQMNISSHTSITKQITKNGNLAPSQNFLKVLPISKVSVQNFLSQKIPLTSTTKQPITCVKNTPMPLKATIVQSTSKSNVEGVSRSKTALSNVSNLNVTNVVDKNASNESLPKEVKNNSIKINKKLQTQQTVAELESNLIRERSSVLNKASALGTLLTNVDKCLMAQSQTATEVSSLIDKLCLAAGRWKAQNRLVTSLVQRVAERQKELSDSHKRFLHASKSCAEVGNQMHGKNYRVPLDKADAMRHQVKQVHEKTQELAKKRTAEQARKSTLEKRAEYCLIRLFSDYKGSNASKANNSKEISKTTVLPITKVLKEAIESEGCPSKLSETPPKNVIGKAPATIACGEMVPADGTVNIMNNCSHKTSSSVSREKSYRFARTKVRTAKAILNVANRKRVSERMNEGCAKRKRMVDISCKDDLSDMDISTDGEDVERRIKYFVGNTEVVDMSVSPDTSLSPPVQEKEFPDPNNSSVGKNLRPHNTGAHVENISSVENSESPAVHRIQTKNEAAACQMRPKKSHIVQEPRSNASLSSASNTLREYVSPLGSFNVFSSSNNDLNAVLCPFDLNGKCEDPECTFKHQHQ